MSILLSLVVFFASSFTYAAIQVYNCDVTAVAKTGSWREPWTKKLLISGQFTNRVDFHDTDLDLTVDSKGNLLGKVNGQPGFILEGHVKQGRFESAYHNGSITCSQKVVLPFVLQFRPWKQFYTVDPIHSRGHILDDFSLQQIDSGLLCFLGDVKEVHALVAQGFGVHGQIINSTRVDFTWEAEDCVHWEGTSPEDTQCLEYRRNQRTKTLRNCHQDVTEIDPRS